MPEKFLSRSEFQRYTKNINRLFGNICRSEYGRTVNFDNTMSTAAMQALIDACLKHIPYGQTLTFQFADGVYTFVNQLTFAGFYGGGNIIIQGDIAEANATALHTTQNVFLDFYNAGSSDCDGIQIIECRIYPVIRNLKVRVNTLATAQHNAAVKFSKTFWGYISYNYCLGVAPASVIGRLILAESGSKFHAIANYVNYGKEGLASRWGSTIVSEGNDDTIVPPRFGLAARAGLIYKGGAQPAGSAANESVSFGGEIR